MYYELVCQRYVTNTRLQITMSRLLKPDLLPLPLHHHAYVNSIKRSFGLSMAARFELYFSILKVKGKQRFIGCRRKEMNMVSGKTMNDYEKIAMVCDVLHSECSPTVTISDVKSAWGLSKRNNWRVTKKRLELKRACLNCCSTKLVNDLAILFEDCQPTRKLTCEALPDNDNRPMIPDEHVDGDAICLEEHTRQLNALVGSKRKRNNKRVPGTRFSGKFNDQVYMHENGNLVCNIALQDGTTTILTVDSVDYGTADLVHDAVEHIKTNAPKNIRKSTMYGVGVRGFKDETVIQYKSKRRPIIHTKLRQNQRLDLQDILSRTQMAVKSHAMKRHAHVVDDIRKSNKMFNLEHCVFGGSEGLTGSNMITCNYENEAHTDCLDLSMSIAVFTIKDGVSGRFLFFPNLRTVINNTEFIGIAIKLKHGTCISWNGKVLRHATTRAVLHGTTNSLFFGVSDYDNKYLPKNC